MGGFSPSCRSCRGRRHFPLPLLFFRRTAHVKEIVVGGAPHPSSFLRSIFSADLERRGSNQLAALPDTRRPMPNLSPSPPRSQ